MGKISMIVAMSKNNVIGKDNQLIWNIPEDLSYFKKKTMGKTIVMGRKTYDSIGKALPGRNNVVLTRNKDFSADNVRVIHNIEDVFEMGNCMIIGGDSLYKAFLPYADVLYVTKIDKEYEGDSFFPEISNQWMKTHFIEGKQSSKNLKYYFTKYEKLNNRGIF